MGHTVGDGLIWIALMGALVAAATAAWLMHDLPTSAIALAAVIGVPIAIGASAYGRHPAVEQ